MADAREAARPQPRQPAATLPSPLGVGHGLVALGTCRRLRLRMDCPVTAVDAPTAEQADLAAVALRVLADLAIPAADVPLTIAVHTLARPWLADALTAARGAPELRATVDAMRMRHRPVIIAPGETRLVCAATRKHPESCDDCRLLWGAER